MSNDLEQLVLRIRSETLRCNLARAHETLENLPALSLRLKEITGKLETTRGQADTHADSVRDTFMNRPAATRERLESAKTFMDDLPAALETIRAQLNAIEGDSFLHKIKQSGVVSWRKELESRAQDLLEDMDSRGGTLAGLTAIERAAKDRVFVESVELLGGIALRDVRLNAEICVLAERLVDAIRASAFGHYALLGGLGIFMTRLDRIIRLPFPLWSLWDLPFAAHELWLIDADREKVRRKYAPGVLPAKVADTLLADAFATYTVGPAYGYAAITLWFDPADPQFDLRVRVIRSMLRAMEPGAGPVDMAYGKVAGDLATAWDAAVAQLRAAPAEAAPAAEDGPEAALFDALRQALPAVAEVPGLREAVALAWRRAAGVAAPSSAASAPAPDDAALATLCTALAPELKRLGYKGFDPEAWGRVQEWRDVLASAPMNAAHDLRHVLNAAWLARVQQPQAGLTEMLSGRAKAFLATSGKSTANSEPAGAPA